ncbi:MAG: RNA polymerase sigma-70 factor [Bacteroidetes bacterium GWF2_42_66]|nr:MAG: RNA polymerase sigma-70 factor [Bacteroidetes bacterium GWA2_42_15]OFX99501.1 MAG: RNA polymerase sigma-70 factor [Bacteroidetes bacterium GWE2_42_39]OFY47032.1 MAG: RNA polymerase sigma-70 factor [Bacteroidetes bacterium GWF2_42_66]HAZ04297.1 RNA polymerase sigma-70 factor [Marinilabiliales bacterium]HBL76809.1 RNA polymerase sigma-70 factor [Prolixibacteraceae bacterium]
MRQYSENEILQELSAGNKNAFEFLYDTYQLRLYHFAFHYLNDEELSKDIVQDVFSIVWEDHKKFEGVSNVSSWLFTLTKNQCLKKIDHLKVKQKYADILKYRQLNIVQDALTELDTSPVTFDEINTIVNQTLSILSPQSRQIFEMSRFENLKNREIAEKLSISQKSVEAHITKALKYFKEALKNYLPFVAFLFLE